MRGWREADILSESVRLSNVASHSESDIPTSVNTTAYHVGSATPDKPFSFDHLGSGEGNLILGPGIYFSSNPQVALLYAKHATKPYMHTVKLDASGYYDPSRGTPKHLREALLSLIQGMVKDGVVTRRFADRGPSSSMKYGKGSIGVVVEALGKVKALKAFHDIGITGAVELTPDGETEYAVYDLNTIKVVESKEL